jgi:hypothetical protein
MFPPEIYSISGLEIAQKLKNRRSHLQEWAETYYLFLSEDVEITGTEKNESVVVTRLNEEETDVAVYKITKEGETKKDPVYHRVFKRSETNEIRFYGIKGNDQYRVTGKVKKGIKVRLIGGTEKDSYVDESAVGGGSHKTKIYDNPGNDIKWNKETAVNLSSDTAINRYDYTYFNHNKKGKVPMIFYSNEDRIFVGMGYTTAKYKWRKYPFANIQYIDVKYSISQKGFSSTYKSVFRELIGKWDLNNFVNYDQIRWTNFYGLGNNTELGNNTRDFNRNRSEEFIASSGVSKVYNNRHKIILNGFIQTYDILNDTGRFLAKQQQVDRTPSLSTNVYAGPEISYVYQHLNDSVLPRKGISFLVTATYIDDLKNKAGSIGRYGAETNLYIPLSKKFSLLVRGGGTTLTGTPKFFQYNRVGGSETLRGHQRDRYYGNSTAFNQNELRFITNIRSRLFNGRIGVFGLYDQARVWLDGEKSDAIHSAYGGGFILSPFNRISVSVAYAVSGEDSNLHLRILRPF